MSHVINNPSVPPRQQQQRRVAERTAGGGGSSSAGGTGRRPDQRHYVPPPSRERGSLSPVVAVKTADAAGSGGTAIDTAGSAVPPATASAAPAPAASASETKTASTVSPPGAASNASSFNRSGSVQQTQRFSSKIYTRSGNQGGGGGGGYGEANSYRQGSGGGYSETNSYRQGGGGGGRGGGRRNSDYSSAPYYENSGSGGHYHQQHNRHDNYANNNDFNMHRTPSGDAPVPFGGFRKPKEYKKPAKKPHPSSQQEQHQPPQQGTPAHYPTQRRSRYHDRTPQPMTNQKTSTNLQHSASLQKIPTSAPSSGEKSTGSGGGGGRQNSVTIINNSNMMNDNSKNININSSSISNNYSVPDPNNSYSAPNPNNAPYSASNAAAGSSSNNLRSTASPAKLTAAGQLMTTGQQQQQHSSVSVHLSSSASTTTGAGQQQAQSSTSAQHVSAATASDYANISWSEEMEREEQEDLKARLQQVDLVRNKQQNKQRHHQHQNVNKNKDNKDNKESAAIVNNKDNKNNKRNNNNNDVTGNDVINVKSSNAANQSAPRFALKAQQSLPGGGCGQSPTDFTNSVSTPAAVPVGPQQPGDHVGGILHMPADLMKEAMESTIKNKKAKGRGRPYLDQEFCRGPPAGGLGGFSKDDHAVGRGMRMMKSHNDFLTAPIQRTGSTPAGTVPHSSGSDPYRQMPTNQQQQQQHNRIRGGATASQQHPPPNHAPSSSTTAAKCSEKARQANEYLEAKIFPQVSDLSRLIKEQFDQYSSTHWFNMEKVLYFRKQLQKLYRDAVTVDLENSFINNLEHRMWKGAFYDIIEVLRTYDDPVKGPKTTERAEEMRLALDRLLEEAVDFYQKLKQDYEQMYDFKLCDHVVQIDENLSDALPGNGQHKSQTLKFALISCQRFEVALGDIGRYREQLKKGQPCDYSMARRYYLNAVQLVPSNGRPYNQLALLAQYTKRKLDTVYYYFRSLAVHHAFFTAVESMKAVFEEINKKVIQHEADLRCYVERVRKKQDEKSSADNRGRGGDRNASSSTNHHRTRLEVWLDWRGHEKKVVEPSTDIVDPESDWLRQPSTQYLYKRFLTYFLHLHGMLFVKINVDQFELMAEKTLIQFRELLLRQETPLTPRQLVQIVVICLFSVEHTNKNPTVNEDTCSTVHHNAVQLCLSVFGLLLERLQELWVKNNQFFPFDDENLHFILPALRLFAMYLYNPDGYKCYSTVGHLTGINTPRFDLNIWSLLAQLCNAIEKHKAESRIIVLPMKINSEKAVILPEDYFCYPFFQIFVNKPMPVFLPTDFPDEKIAAEFVRIDSLTQLVMFLDGIQEEGSKNAVVRFDEKTQCYVVNSPVAAAAVPVSAPSPRLPTRRRSTASETENEYQTNQLQRLSIDSGENVYASEEMKQFKLHKRDEEMKQKLLEDEQCRLILKVDPKYLVPDTNSFIDHLSGIKTIVKCQRLIVAVPTIVLTELNGLSKNTANEWVSNQAKLAREFLRDFSNDESYRKYVKAITTSGAVMDSLEFVTENFEGESVKVNNDDRILRCCEHFPNADEKRPTIKDLKNEPLTFTRHIVLLTDDRNLRVKALSKNVPVRTVSQFLKWCKL